MGDGEVGRCFLNAAAKPIIFLLRDPRLTIESRLRMVLTDLTTHPETAEQDRCRIDAAISARDYSALDDLVTEALFPIARTGWSQLEPQLDYCRQHELDFVIVDAKDFRARPRHCLERLCSHLRLGFEANMVSWSPTEELPTGQLADQANWYKRVRESVRVLPESEQPLEGTRFPGRFQAHLDAARRIFARARGDNNSL